MQTASAEPRAPEGEGDDCVSDDELLRFVGGAVDDARAAEIRAHVDVCDDCRELLAIAGREAAGAEPATARNRAGANDGMLAPKEEDRSLIEVGSEVEGRFRIEREIGRGGMGVVYAASHLTMRKKVAFKVLNEETAADDECVARFLRETRVAAKLISPHAVRVFDVGRLQSGAPYMVMELLEGQDLERALDVDGVFDVPRALDTIAQACDAIGEAHLVGIVHRDIKLANLFLADAAPHPIVKVLDFGLAKGGTAIGAESSLTHAEALMGTPHYMPPEQLASSRDVDARADVWSLGVALYRLLTKRYPFNGAHFAALAARILAGAPAPPSQHRPDLPPAIDRLVMTCLARDPKDRYADANELAKAIAKAQSPQEPITKPVSAPTAAAKIGDHTLTLPAYPSPAAQVAAPVAIAAAPPLALDATMPAAPIPERISTVPLHPRPGAVATAKTRAIPAERPMWPYVLIVSVIGIGVAGAVLRRPASNPDPTPPVASIPEPPATAAAATTASTPSPAIQASTTATASAPEITTAAGRPGAHGPRRGTKPGATAPRTPSSGAPPASAEKHYEKM